jgi:hypothetical protein
MPDIKNVRKIQVTTADGLVYEWSGERGYVSIMTLAHRPEGSSQAAAVPRARQVQVQLTIPLAFKEVKEVVEEEADSGVQL